MMLKDERGNAALELMLLAPALLLLIAVIAGTGRLFGTKSAIEAVAREAGRIASQASDAPTATTMAEERALDSAEGLGLDPNRIDVTTNAESFDRGSPLTVSVSYRVNLADLPGFGIIPGSMTVEAKHVEIIERYKSR